MTPCGMRNPDATYLPLRSSLGHSIFTTALKIAFSSSGGSGGATGIFGGSAGVDDADEVAIALASGERNGADGTTICAIIFDGMLIGAIDSFLIMRGSD